MKIQQVNNYNVSHKAYFKNDSAGMLRRFWNNSEPVSESLKKTAKEFREICPNHGIELVNIEIKGVRNKIGEVFNTVTGEKFLVNANENENFIEKVMSMLVNKAKKNDVFFKETTESAKIFKMITNQ